MQSFAFLIFREKKSLPNVWCLNNQTRGVSMNELVFGKLVDELKLRGRSEGTISAYRTEVLRFVKDFARPLDELSIQDIKAYQLKMIEAGYKNRTVNLRMAALRFFCLHVLEKDWVEKFTPRMKECKTLPNHLSPGEVAALVCSCESRLERVLLMMIYATGLRVGEMVSIKIEDLKKDNATIEVLGKGNKKRLVPFCMDLRKELQRYWWCNRRPDWTGFLFPSQDDKMKSMKTSEIYRIFIKAMKTSGIKKRGGPHILRHSFSTRLLELGVSIREIQIILGHSQLRTTEIYTHLRVSQLSSMKNPLADIVQKINIAS